MTPCKLDISRRYDVDFSKQDRHDRVRARPPHKDADCDQQVYEDGQCKQELDHIGFLLDFRPDVQHFVFYAEQFVLYGALRERAGWATTRASEGAS